MAERIYVGWRHQSPRSATARPITAENEMAETIENVINKLKADKEYKKMFKVRIRR
jgi:cytochrome c peroxidase